MTQSLICIFTLLLSSFTPIFANELTPEQSIIFQELKKESAGKYSDDLLEELAIEAAKMAPGTFYHEQNIIDKLRDKMIMLGNDGAYIPQSDDQSFLPQDEAVDSEIIINENSSFYKVETHRYVTNEIEGYDKGQLGLEVKRSLDTSSEPAKIIIGIRVFATENFKVAVDSTAIVINSAMDPAQARLNLDQAINTLARKVGRKLAGKLSPDVTEHIFYAMAGAGAIASGATMLWVFRKMMTLGKGKMKRLGCIALAAWALTAAGFLVMDNYGDLQFIGELKEEADGNY